jgi:hypothetical protein
MPTIIDSLIVTLGLDSKDVDSKAPGVRAKLSELEKTASKAETGVHGIGKASKGTASELTNLSAKLTSFLAVIGSTVAVSAFIKDTIETNTQLYFLSRNLDMNTQKIFAWGAAAKEIGGSAGTVQNFMRQIAAMPGELLTGKMPQLLPLFARLGISFREPFDQIMVDLSKRFAGMDRKMAFSFGLASGIPEDVMNLLLQGPGAVQGAIARTKGFGPTEKEAASAAELKRRFTDLELLIVKIGYDLLYKVTPYLEKFLDLLLKVGAWAQRHENIVAVIVGIAAALAAVAALGTALGAVATAWVGLMGALEAAWPVLAIAGIVAALGAAILLLWQDYKVWSVGGKSFFDWTAWTNMISSAVDAWDNLSNAIKGAVEWVGKWYQRAANGLGIDTSEEFQQQAEKKAIEAYNRAHPNANIAETDDATKKLAREIARREGFYDSRSGYVPNANGVGTHFSTEAKSNIPQKANNPGDILYGDFAKSYGANGFVIAQGGKKIATFPDERSGWMAMYALLQSKGYAGLSTDQKIARWQTGSSTGLINGISSATQLPSSITHAQNTSNSTVDNSKVTNIGTINVHGQKDVHNMTPSMARGMDWTTLTPQLNFGQVP